MTSVRRMFARVRRSLGAAKNGDPEGVSDEDALRELKRALDRLDEWTEKMSQIGEPDVARGVRFVEMESKEEFETVELLRRIAELVAVSERKAGRILARTTDDEAAALPHLAPFELFCERNALANVVNIVTGAAFTSRKPEMEIPTSTTTCLLPPLSIATQAVQSVSILVQNVSRATSLYFLLSNNRVNDLINLPLQLYQSAERQAFLRSQTTRGRSSPTTEMGELATHFVSFLKSLAMRINAETLQFFLSYDSTDKTKLDFPLYARALDFCDAEQDPFVRVTAMNVCMNVLRLAARGRDDDHDNHFGRLSPASLPTTTPTGALHEAPALPLRDRVAIARYACHPRRVNDLVAPLFARLTGQFGQVEGTVRALEELARSMPKTFSKEGQDVAEQKRRLVDAVRDLTANVQDELLLLDDLLKVGLASLNEQAIEMMLAAFVYPMLLQPLLLPPHRFSSPGDAEIVPRSPPFSFLSDHGATDPSRSDPAPSKTALFGLSVLFRASSDPALRILLLTASLHPLSPRASGGEAVRVPPRATLPGRGTICDPYERALPLYGFGTNRTEGGGAANASDEADGARSFVLAPALADVLSDGTRRRLSRRRPSSDRRNANRPNPYRRILLSFVSASRETASLRSLATAAIHAAVSSADGWIVRKILFASDDAKPWMTEREGKRVDDHVGGGASATQTVDDGGASKRDPNVAALASSVSMKETLQCLGRSIVNVSVARDGWWKATFDRVAARTLVDVVSDDRVCLNLLDSIVTEIRLEAAAFLLSLPSRFDKKTREGETANAKSDPVDDQHLDSWLLDRFFFDSVDKHTNSVVENVCYLKEQGEGEESKSQYRYGLEVLATSSVTDAVELLCDDSHIMEDVLVSESKGNTPFACAASWALACLYLDAFCTKISKAKLMHKNRNENEDAVGSGVDVCLPQKKLSYIDNTSCDDGVGSERSHSLAHISSKLAIAILDEGESSESKKGEVAPAHGSVVGLVGKATFPCVCEVSPSFSSLFSGRTCISNDGIQWQSLYLVVVGKWAVLAEPERGGTGGEGRVITVCKLACLAIKKDTSTPANNSSPARRLLVAHSSLDPRPPSLFVMESVSSRRGPNLGPDGLRLTRSRMDLWFEDSNAAGHAWKVLSAKIAKAKARRGGRIRAALLARG